MNNKKVAIASDHAGVELKEVLKQDLALLDCAVTDLGPNETSSVDYPDYANKLADWIKQNADSAGILICGSGIGMSMAANRHKHIRAALVSTVEQAALARQHNNANVLCLGARQISEQTARECIKTFLTTGFEGGRHAGRIAKMS
ncbi:MAG: ribose 5-phosphate isomerase B [Alphaproteobacteria bacterium]